MMSRMSLVMGSLTLAGLLAGCSTVCNSTTCANGCCKDGECITAFPSSACGIDGGACVDCTASGQTCQPGAGVCVAPGTGGGSGQDAGVNCAVVAHDAVLGTMVVDGGATVVASGPLPAGVVALARVGSTYHVLTESGVVRPAGTSLGSLAPSGFSTSIINPADNGTTVFVGQYLAPSGTRLGAGYTRLDQSGVFAMVETADGGGLTTLAAPGNYTATGIPGGFVVNGKGLGPATDGGAFVRDGLGEFALFTFPAGSSSGFTARTDSEVLLVGFAEFAAGTNTNYVRGASPSLVGSAITARMPRSVNDAAQLFSATDLLGLTTVQNDAITVHGGFAPVTFEQFNTRIERRAVQLTGSTVSVGPATVIASFPDACTTVVFATGIGNRLVLGLKDRNGRRVVELSP